MKATTKLIASLSFAAIAGIAPAAYADTDSGNYSKETKQQGEDKAFFEAQVLKEASWTFPAIDEYMQQRKAALARADADKAAKGQAALAK